MAAELAQYDAKTVSVALDAHVVTGLAEDEFISIEYNADAFEIITGADGEVARSKINDSTATATL
ncbi:DUF3277 domain-containing protein, partial [Candidatus Pacearchaeota archaeon]|nr:DUF3277 domain-containing protein [Candidatus Pacearchaeota archaeon]